MKKKTLHPKPQTLNPYSGQAALVALLSIGIVVLVLGVSIAVRGSISILASRRSQLSQNAFYAAQSGIDDALEKIGRNKDFVTNGGSDTDATECNDTTEKEYYLDLGTNGGDTCVEVKVGGTSDARVITSRGKREGNVRKIKMDITVGELNTNLGKITITSWSEIE